MVGACVMPEGYGVENHHLFVLDFLISSLIGQMPPRIICSGARRLNTKIPSTKDNYTNVLENLVLRYRLTERMVAEHNENSSIVLVKYRIDIIDQKGVQYMHHAWKEDRSNLLQRIKTDWCSIGNTGYSCGRSMCDAGSLWGRR